MAALRELAGDEDWDRAVPILRQLWSHRDEAFVRSWREEEDYRLLGRFVESRDGAQFDSSVGGDADGETERLVAVAGIYVQTVIHHERSLWVHDLVVDEAHRGEGHGAALLADLEAWGEERDCDHVALVCAADNGDAAAFYEHVGMDEFGTVYEADLQP